MIMFGTLNFPPDSAKAVAERYAQAAPVPEFMKVSGPYIRSDIANGISTLSIFEFEDGRADEALDYLKKRYATFAAVPGTTSTIEEWLGIEAAFQVLEEMNSVTSGLEAVSLRI